MAFFPQAGISWHRFLSIALGAVFPFGFSYDLAAVTLASPFAENAVLQREKPVPIWGKGNPGEAVTVEFQAQSKETAADKEGHWKVVLDPMSASVSSSRLVVKGAESGVVEIGGILVGDVWFCAGQSNMQWIVSRSTNSARESAAADYPEIRMFRVRYGSADQPQETLGTDVQWSVCTPKRVGSFSAVAYYFGKELHRELGVPIGIINSSWGGTQIESWMNGEALANSGHQADVARRWNERMEKYPAHYALYEKALARWEAEGGTKSKPRPPEGPGSRWVTSGLFNAMVYPLMPYSIRGIAWYQGETNAPRFHEYGALFQAMIRQWRSDFQQGDELPFYFVQIANFTPPREPTGVQWAFQREAQTAALKLPATGMVVTIDLGEPKQVHFPNKEEVGKRLALVALARAYKKDIVDSGPVFLAAKPDGSRLQLSFDAKGKSLMLREAASSGFEVAGEDKRFYPAKAVVEGASIGVFSPDVPKPVAVRYAWHNTPSVTLYNEAGLPAAPFRSDTWAAPQSGSVEDATVPE